MPDQLDPKDIDKRTAQRYVRMGLLDEKTYEKFLKSLPDVADKGTPLETVMFENEGDDDAEE